MRDKSRQLQQDVFAVAKTGILRRDMLLYKMLENPENVIEALEVRRGKFV